MTTPIFAFLFGLFLAYANGANDNFKGVATLFGSGTTNFRVALSWATVSTLLGSLTAVFLAGQLLSTFSGKGLVPDAVVATKSFSLAVVLAAALTVWLATKLGFPISTTHAITGGLVGAGFVASASGVNLSRLSSTFFLPLLVSPVLSMALASLVYFVSKSFGTRAGLCSQSCICVDTTYVVPALRVVNGYPQAATAVMGAVPRIVTGTEKECATLPGIAYALPLSAALNGAHYLSAGVVSFSRGLNDTPKIAALLLIGSALSPLYAIFAVAVVMGLGGFLNSKKIAETMSMKVTTMDPFEGFTANLVTGILVLFASRWGLPVSTTHVSCGALFGIGTVTQQAKWKTIGHITLAWVTTLPLSGILGAGLCLLLRTCL